MNILPSRASLKVNEYSGAVAPGIPIVNESGCVKCGGGRLSLPIQRSGNASSQSLDLSLCGDPLMYATFVAPVQQGRNSFSSVVTTDSKQEGNGPWDLRATMVMAPEVKFEISDLRGHMTSDF